ncbi:hypothetical protein HKX48_008136 [Thoreauomyces humboldtii]|nr:hypothetical protein HKX48_008136 [Thoreauomyces humboldtii]
MDVSANPPPPAPAKAVSETTPSTPYTLDMGHQEIERLIEELEKIYRSSPVDDYWLPADNITTLLCSELGYEDLDEFEDSLNGTFSQFLHAIPTIETKTDAATGVLSFRFRREVARDEWVAKRWTINITDRSQLNWVLAKSPHATIEIPELEFEIVADGRRRIDTFYNHVASAAFNLAEHVRGGATGDLPDHQRDSMADCIASLEELLDVDRPWTFVVHDPSGTSEFEKIENDQVDVERGLTVTFD